MASTQLGYPIPQEDDDSQSIDSPHDRSAHGLDYIPPERDDQQEERETRKSTRLYTVDMIDSWPMEEIQKTIQELVATKLSTGEAKVLQALRRREEDLRSKEMLEVATNQANAARDSDSDTETIHGNDQHTTPQETILKPQKQTKSQELTLEGLKHINLKHANIQPLQPYRGKGDEDWPKFKNKLITHFNTMELDDEQAATQFCAYVEDNAYRVWEGLSEATKKSFPETLRAFDRHYDDVQKHGYWQIKYENMTYGGPSKESLDDLAIRITECVNRAYPDYAKKGKTYSQHAIQESLHPEEILGTYATKHTTRTFHPLWQK